MDGRRSRGRKKKEGKEERPVIIETARALDRRRKGAGWSERRIGGGMTAAPKRRGGARPAGFPFLRGADAFLRLARAKFYPRRGEALVGGGCLRTVGICSKFRGRARICAS